MSEMDPKLMRRILGLGEIKEGGDPEVLARRKYHVSIAKWLAKWLPWMQVLSATIGIIFIFLPAVWLEWRTMLMGVPAIYNFSVDLYLLKVTYLKLLFIMLIPTIISNLKAKTFPGGWDPSKQFGFPSVKQISDLDLYPNKKEEELVYWAHICACLFSPLWYLLACGLIGFFYKGVNL